MLNFDNNPQCSCFYSWPREEKKLFLASFDQPHSVMRVTFEIYQWIMIVIWCPFQLHYQLTDDRNDIAFKKRRHLNWANLSWSNIRSLECHFFLHFFLEPSSSLPSCPQCRHRCMSMAKICQDNAASRLTLGHCHRERPEQLLYILSTDCDTFS